MPSSQAEGLQSFTFNNFRGLNKLSSRLNMSPEFAWNIRNAYIKKDVKTGLGIIKQRSGSLKYNSVAFTGKCRFIYEAKWDSGGLDTIIRNNDGWHKYDGVDSFDDFDVGRTSDVRGQAVMFGNQLIMADGGKLRKSTAAYSISDLSVDANMPTDSNIVHVHQHKVWTNSIANPMKAYACKTDNANGATAWTGTTDAAVLDFSRILPDGDTLIGFATFSQSYLLFIFKNYIVLFSCGTDPAAFSLVQVIPVDCLSWHTVYQVGNDLAFASLAGINSFKSAVVNQQVNTDDLTKYIGPYYRELVGDLTDTSEISSGFSSDLNHYYTCITISGDHTILVYSLDIGNIVGIWNGIDAYSFCELRDGTMLAGGNGYVRIMNTGDDDDGSAIDFQYSFPYLYFNDANQNKAVRQFEGIISHQATTTSFNLNFDYSYGTGNEQQSAITKSIALSANVSLYRSALYRSAYYRASGNTRYSTSDILGRGKQMALDIYHSVLDASIEIPYIVMRAKLEGIKIR